MTTSMAVFISFIFTSAIFFVSGKYVTDHSTAAATSVECTQDYHNLHKLDKTGDVYSVDANLIAMDKNAREVFVFTLFVIFCSENSSVTLPVSHATPKTTLSLAISKGMKLDASTQTVNWMISTEYEFHILKSVHRMLSVFGNFQDSYENVSLKCTVCVWLLTLNRCSENPSVFVAIHVKRYYSQLLIQTVALAKTTALSWSHFRLLLTCLHHKTLSSVNSEYVLVTVFGMCHRTRWLFHCLEILQHQSIGGATKDAAKAASWSLSSKYMFLPTDSGPTCQAVLEYYTNICSKPVNLRYVDIRTKKRLSVHNFLNAKYVVNTPPYHHRTSRNGLINLCKYIGNLLCIFVPLSSIWNSLYKKRNIKKDKTSDDAATRIYKQKTKCHKTWHPFHDDDPFLKDPASRKESILHSIIHHPWRLFQQNGNHTRTHKFEPRPQHLRSSSKCLTTSSLLCPQCVDNIRVCNGRDKDEGDTKKEERQHKSGAYDESSMHYATSTYKGCDVFHKTGSLVSLAGQDTIHVYPVTRFLPDTTHNPYLDLAHVGYRLATLGALPASVPVSRVRLADAGFYFRGEGDQVTCYSCNVQHSGWTREDNPLEVHRRLSPRCQHLLQLDEVSGSVTTSASQDRAGSVEGQSDRTGGSNPSNNRGDSSHPATNSPHALVSSGSPASYQLSQSHNDENSTAAQNRSNENPSTLPNTTATGSSAIPRIGPLTTSLAQVSASTSTSFPRRSDVTVDDSTPSIAQPRSSSTTNNPSRNEPAIGTRTSQGSVNVPAGGASSIAGASPVPSIADAQRRTSGTPIRQLFPRARLDLNGAVYPMYQDMASRRRTFPSWDESRAPPLTNILLSGMFYGGYGDCVRCFYCGVGLKHWGVTHDVWTEHVRWRPGCQYLLAIKGEEFIRRIQRSIGIDVPDTPAEPPRNDTTAVAATSTITTTTSNTTASTSTSITTASNTTASTSTSTTNATSTDARRVQTSTVSATPSTTSSRTNQSTNSTGTAGNTNQFSGITASTLLSGSTDSRSESARDARSSTGANANTAGAMASIAGAMASTTGAVASTTGAMASTTGAVASTTGAMASTTGAMASTPGAMTGTTGVASTPGAVTSTPVVITTFISTPADYYFESMSPSNDRSGNGNDFTNNSARRPLGGSNAEAVVPSGDRSDNRSGSSSNAGAGGSRLDNVESVEGRGGSRVTDANNERRDPERLARLQAENRALRRNFLCRICQQHDINTIFMPCGHLVVCETCAGTVTSCLLCGVTIRATARVHMA